MPPSLAFSVYALCIAGLLRRDVRRASGVSHALWIPVAWMVVSASRWPSDWLNGGRPVAVSADALLEGSPIDRNIVVLLIGLGVVVLLSRSVSWPDLLARNRTIALFLLYTFLSILWSDFPLIAFKRWTKLLGHIVMALVVVTEREPGKAFNALFRRCGFILIPVSVLFVKYYPELGRGYDQWTGAAVYTGVTTNKNALGSLCLIIGLFFMSLLAGRSEGRKLVGGLDRYISVVFLGMIGWLLSLAHCATAVAAGLLGVSVILGAQVGPIRQHFSKLLILGCLTVAFLQSISDVNVKDVVSAGLGRDATLTGRTELWDTLGAMEGNALVGVGFESFWLGSRLETLWGKYWWKPNQAHNGYYETYLNLGLIGLTLQCAMILACYLKERRDMLVARHGDATATPAQDGRAPLGLAFVLALIASNVTEASFKAMNLSFFVFFVIALDYRVLREKVRAAHVTTGDSGRRLARRSSLLLRAKNTGRSRL